MRFSLLPTLALAFYCATFVAEKLLLRYLGLGLALANWLSAALIFLPLLCATVYRIRVEEEALREHFGEEYANYASVTKRLVPGIY